jgi:hypothetical protein
VKSAQNSRRKLCSKKQKWYKLAETIKFFLCIDFNGFELSELGQLYACISCSDEQCTIIVDQNSVVAISGMRDSGACWIPNIGRMDDFRTSDSGRTPLWRVRQKTPMPFFF